MEFKYLYMCLRLPLVVPVARHVECCANNAKVIGSYPRQSVEFITPPSIVSYSGQKPLVNAKLCLNKPLCACNPLTPISCSAAELETKPKW